MLGDLKFYSKSKPRKRPEAQLQKAVVQIAKLCALPGVLWHSIPNEGVRSAVYGHEMKLMGLRPGAGDMLFIIKGKAHYLELKAQRKKQTPEQVEFEAAAIAAGAIYRVADNIDDAANILAEWKAIAVFKRAA